MIRTPFFRTLRTRYAAYAAARRETIARSSEVLTLSKQAIFAFHRGDLPGGGALLERADKALSGLARSFKKTHGLSDEGAYRAALEEYAEARIFAQFLRRKALGPVEAPGMDEDVYLGGLLDFTGEAVRHAVRAATAKDEAEVRRAHRAVEAVAGELIRMDITGPLRSKYDQLKTNLRKLEEILYDLSLR